VCGVFLFSILANILISSFLSFRLAGNGFGYEQCGFCCTLFPNSYVVYIYSLFSILSRLPALLIAVVVARFFSLLSF